MSRTHHRPFRRRHQNASAAHGDVPARCPPGAPARACSTRAAGDGGWRRSGGNVRRARVWSVRPRSTGLEITPRGGPAVGHAGARTFDRSRRRRARVGAPRRAARPGAAARWRRRLLGPRWNGRCEGPGVLIDKARGIEKASQLSMGCLLGVCPGTPNTTVRMSRCSRNALRIRFCHSGPSRTSLGVYHPLRPRRLCSGGTRAKGKSDICARGVNSVYFLRRVQKPPPRYDRGISQALATYRYRVSPEHSGLCETPSKTTTPICLFGYPTVFHAPWTCTLISRKFHSHALPPE